MPRRRPRPVFEWNVGDHVQVSNTKGVFYDAKVEKIKDDDRRSAIFISWPRYPKYRPVWVSEPSKVRAPIERVDQQLETAQTAHGSTQGVSVVDGEVLYDMIGIRKRQRRGKKVFYERRCSGRAIGGLRWARERVHVRGCQYTVLPSHLPAIYYSR